MCYPNTDTLVGIDDKRERNRRFVPPVEGQRGVERDQMQVQVTSRVSDGNGSSGAAGMMKQCVCSPTHHPGSFRCRQHHADYKWTAQQGTKATH
ncbi:unnamed protein product [Withania somnifera]